MRFSFLSLFLTVLFILPAFSQDAPRKQKFDEVKQLTAQLKRLREERLEITKQQLSIIAKLKSVSENDSTEAEKAGAKAVRLFPCCASEEKVRAMDELSYFNLSDKDLVEGHDPLRLSSYLLSDSTRYLKEGNSIEFTAALLYKENLLTIEANDRGNHGFIIDVGKMPFESIDEQSSAVAALAEYRPPAEMKNIKSEYRGGELLFRRSASAAVGNTYILRAVSYEERDARLDKIFVLKVHRRDGDGSLILFIKTVKAFEPPKLKDPRREEYERLFNLGLVAKLKEELRAGGFNEIEVEISGKTVTLKGTVPSGKTADAIIIATETYIGVTFKNELIEK